MNLDYLPRMPENRAVGIGCVGTGFIMADCHLVAYRQAGFRPVAIFGRNVEHAHAVAARHQVCACTTLSKRWSPIPRSKRSTWPFRPTCSLT